MFRNNTQVTHLECRLTIIGKIVVVEKFLKKTVSYNIKSEQVISY